MASPPGAAGAVIKRRRPSRLRAFLETAPQAAGLAEAGLRGEDLGLGSGVENKKIVVVSTEPGFAPALVIQAVGVAGRLGAEIVALTVGRPGMERAKGQRGPAQQFFWDRTARAVEDFSRQAREAGVGFRHVARFGRPADVVESECGRLRRVEFVLTLKKQRTRAGLRVSMPLFEVA